MNQDYLRLFETESDYDSAKPDFVYPTVSYVRDVDDVRYMENPLATPFYIEALADGMTVTLSNSSQGITAPANDLEYSTDQQVWTTLPNNIASPAINTGERIYLRGNAIVNKSGMGEFAISQQCNVGGNIMSLLFNDNFESKTDLTGYDAAFAGLFDEQPVVNASDLILPATTLTVQCYWGMFYGCESLTTAPRILPATTLTDLCYGGMFQNCTSLVTASELPATILANECYYMMFAGCTSLSTTPALPATTLASWCYAFMFQNCTSLTTPPALPATTLAGNCYNGMFSYCESLTTAPELPATILAERCYYEMFYGCYLLTTAPELPATTLTDLCYGAMFQNCTSLTTPPALPATTLASWCYSNMFNGCSILSYIQMLATDISATGCLNKWVNNVSSTGTFVKNPALSVETIGRGANGIPVGWTVVDAA